MSDRCVVVVFCFCVFVCNFAAKAQSPLNPLPKLNIDTSNGITLSGVSSGAAFASQFHVSFSKTVAGVAMFAGPPYYCAQGNVEVAVSACMEYPDDIVVASLVEETGYAFDLLTIDNPDNIQFSKVWLYTGQDDTVVVPGVVAKTDQYYNAFGANIKFYNQQIKSEHAWLSTNQNITNKCGLLGSPYMNNCHFDAAGDFLKHFYGSVADSTTAKVDRLFSFKQSTFIDDPEAFSMSKLGFVYIPQQCQTGAIACQLHVAFHGCLMGYETIGLDFVTYSGLNGYAESNNLVILYPQVSNSSVTPYNPKGCWDWWGYAGEDYACQLGPQMHAIAKMIDTLTQSCHESLTQQPKGMGREK
eukprot:m.78161 g.78161  ORF g.78161 m.78161 type:complete len:357 (+) comp11946_c0_seq1:126-1196(+)